MDTNHLLILRMKDWLSIPRERLDVKPIFNRVGDLKSYVCNFARLFQSANLLLTHFRKFCYADFAFSYGPFLSLCLYRMCVCVCVWVCVCVCLCVYVTIKVFLNVYYRKVTLFLKNHHFRLKHWQVIREIQFFPFFTLTVICKIKRFYFFWIIMQTAAADIENVTINIKYKQLYSCSISIYGFGSF